jgi:hypothetical protein
VSDIEEQFADLAQSHPGRHAYTAMDRYRDFRAVFLGSDQGKRVLHEILGRGHVLHAGMSFDTNRTFFHEGERNVALWIFGTARVEPKALPATQSKTTEE